MNLTHKDCDSYQHTQINRRAFELKGEDVLEILLEKEN
jgi:hypothetical protein